ncbi:MAG TPA: hypothetical protein VMG12_42295 [Polyangiaceae bacterium]|nr:hypothetical protein [Polyangiaceae bacterium]
MKKRMIRTGFEVVATLGLVASLGPSALAADIFDETISVIRDGRENNLPAVVDGREVGRGSATVGGGNVTLEAQAFPSILEFNDDFEVQSNLRRASDDFLIRGIGVDTISEVSVPVPDPGVALDLQVVVSVF